MDLITRSLMEDLHQLEVENSSVQETSVILLYDSIHIFNVTRTRFVDFLLHSLLRLNLLFLLQSKIMQLTSEVDLAVENYAAEVKNENERKTKIIKNKLKPKGGIPPEAV